MSTFIFVCNNRQIYFFFLLKDVWLTNPHDIPLNQTQLFPPLKYTIFKNSGHSYYIKPGLINSPQLTEIRSDGWTFSSTRIVCFYYLNKFL
jgi:hypothetical protein